jgi:methyl-accepting chemotaxis protein
MLRLFFGRSLQRRFTLWVGAGLVALSVGALYAISTLQQSQMRHSLEQFSRSELESLHALIVTAMNVRPEDSGDIGIRVFNEWFSQRNRDYPGEVWSVWGPQVRAFMNETSPDRSPKLPRDSIDEEALATGKQVARLGADSYRISMPIVLGITEGANKETCHGCHGAMGMKDGDVIAVLSSRVDVAAERDRQWRIVGTVLLIGAFLVLVTILALRKALIRLITGPIGAMTETMEALARGRHDISIGGVGRRDEIGAMARAVEVFRENAVERERLERQQAVAEEEAAHARRQAVLDMAEKIERETSTAIGNIETNTRQVGGAAENMSQFANLVSEDSRLVAVASEQTLANTQMVAAAADELSGSIHQIMLEVERASTLTKTAVSHGAQAEATIRSLTEAVARISEVTRLINAIADQTNLLALNATIEAARAGAAGKGFAVVAAEVKNLANQTARSTEDINRQVTEIELATEAAVRAVSDIGAQIQEIDSVASTIKLTMEHQGEATQEIARNVAQTADASHEVSDKIQGVSEKANQVGARAGQVRHAIENVTENIAGLRETLVRVVRTSTEDANRRLSARRSVDMAGEIVEDSGRRCEGRVVDLSENGASLLCSHAGEFPRDVARTLALPGLTIRIPFAIRGAGRDRVHIEFRLTGAQKDEYLKWLAGRAIESHAA